MNVDYCIATFCYGEKYYSQVNRMISEIDKCDFKPTVVVVTDDVKKILDKHFVKVYDISEFNPDYKNYNDTYYTFDFSVKRYSLLAALNLGFTKIILSDADAVPNKQLFNDTNISKGFVRNSIQGQVTYNFYDQTATNSELGKRLLEYEKHFNVVFDKELLNFMPEDCIQFLDIDTDKFYNFLRVWDECIVYKKKNNLRNVPAGNIDEMCFAALKCGLTVGNNSGKTMNSLTPIHDKWYDSSFADAATIEKENRKKIVVTSVYELNYINDRGSGVYKSFDLLTQTIRNIIFDDFEYVIYTDKKTFDKHDLSKVFHQNNVTIKIVELNSDFYLNYLNPIREKRVKDGEIWDRIHSVENYIEVILNKIEFMLNDSADEESDVVWIDSGMLGTSCGNGWRDYMNEICHTKTFINKIFEKIQQHDFFALMGNHILINYEVKDKINQEFNCDLKIIPGCLFGGKAGLIREYFKDYKDVLQKVVEKLDDYTSEQELLYLLLNNRSVMFFDFNDWDDLQKGLLKMLDIYDEDIYNKNSCLAYKQETKKDFDYTNKSFTEIADLVGMDRGTLHEGHNYTGIYENLLTKYKTLKPVIVEIGINDPRFPGACLQFWDIIFQEMDYYGFDITDCSNLDYNSDKIQIFKGDQNNKNNLLEFVYKYSLPNRIDFIIDDGSHYSEHILTSFETLYPFLKDGGIYFIEDLHAGWAERDKTLTEIDNIIQKNNFKFSSKVLEGNQKLLIITK